MVTVTYDIWRFWRCHFHSNFRVQGAENPAEVSKLRTAFDLLQDGNDLCLLESGFLHRWSPPRLLPVCWKTPLIAGTILGDGYNLF